MRHKQQNGITDMDPCEEKKKPHPSPRLTESVTASMKMRISQYPIAEVQALLFTASVPTWCKKREIQSVKSLLSRVSHLQTWHENEALAVDVTKQQERTHQQERSLITNLQTRSGIQVMWTQQSKIPSLGKEQVNQGRWQLSLLCAGPSKPGHVIPAAKTSLICHRADGPLPLYQERMIEKKIIFQNTKIRAILLEEMVQVSLGNSLELKEYIFLPSRGMRWVYMHAHKHIHSRFIIFSHTLTPAPTLEE